MTILDERKSTFWKVVVRVEVGGHSGGRLLLLWRGGRGGFLTLQWRGHQLIVGFGVVVGINLDMGTTTLICFRVGGSTCLIWACDFRLWCLTYVFWVRDGLPLGIRIISSSFLASSVLDDSTLHSLSLITLHLIHFVTSYQQLSKGSPPQIWNFRAYK